MARSKKEQQQLFLAMPFDEAVARFVRTDPQEQRVNLAKAHKKSRSGLPQSGHEFAVVRLSDRRQGRQRHA